MYQHLSESSFSQGTPMIQYHKKLRKQVVSMRLGQQQNFISIYAGCKQSHPFHKTLHLETITILSKSPFTLVLSGLRTWNRHIPIGNSPHSATYTLTTHYPPNTQPKCSQGQTPLNTRFSTEENVITLTDKAHKMLLRFRWFVAAPALDIFLFQPFIFLHLEPTLNILFRNTETQESVQNPIVNLPLEIIPIYRYMTTI